MARPGAEVRLALARAELTAGDPAAAIVELAAAAAEEPDDWRIDWYRGVAALFTAPAEAVAAFDRAYLTFPGELAPKLALAVAAECAGDDERARRYYALLARIEPSLADAAFGLARTALRAGDRATAVAALDAVPDTSSRHVAAQLAAIDATLAGRTGLEIGDADLRAAAARVPGLPLDPGTAEQVRTALFTAAVELVSGNGSHGNQPPLLGHAWQERDLRLALERSLRTSATALLGRGRARAARRPRPNAARPRTLRPGHLDGPAVCPICGSPPRPSADRFCELCGARLHAAERRRRRPRRGRPRRARRHQRPRPRPPRNEDAMALGRRPEAARRRRGRGRLRRRLDRPTARARLARPPPTPRSTRCSPTRG